MLVWYLGATFAAAWMIFHDRSMNLRWLGAGALLPAALVLFTLGWPGAHSILLPIVLLCVAMLVTRRRRRARRSLLVGCIGVFIGLLASGAWLNEALFLYPLLGTQVDESVPILARPWWVSICLEVVGAGLLIWWWRQWQPQERIATTTSTSR